MSIPRLKSYLSIIATVLVLGQAVIAQAVELPDFTQLVEQASPAVVNISTTQKLPDRKVSQQMPDLEGPETEGPGKPGATVDAKPDKNKKKGK